MGINSVFYMSVGLNNPAQFLYVHTFFLESCLEDQNWNSKNLIDFK